MGSGAVKKGTVLWWLTGRAWFLLVTILGAGYLGSAEGSSLRVPENPTFRDCQELSRRFHDVITSHQDSLSTCMKQPPRFGEVTICGVTRMDAWAQCAAEDNALCSTRKQRNQAVDACYAAAKITETKGKAAEREQAELEAQFKKANDTYEQAGQVFDAISDPKNYVWGKVSDTASETIIGLADIPRDGNHPATELFRGVQNVTEAAGAKVSAGYNPFIAEIQKQSRAVIGAIGQRALNELEATTQLIDRHFTIDSGETSSRFQPSKPPKASGAAHEQNMMDAAFAEVESAQLEYERREKIRQERLAQERAEQQRIAREQQRKFEEEIEEESSTSDWAEVGKTFLETVGPAYIEYQNQKNAVKARSAGSSHPSGRPDDWCNSIRSPSEATASSCNP